MFVRYRPTPRRTLTLSALGTSGACPARPDHCPGPLVASGPSCSTSSARAPAITRRRMATPAGASCRARCLPEPSLRAHLASPRCLSSRLVALLCVTLVPLAALPLARRYSAGGRRHHRTRRHGVRVRHRVVPRLDLGPATQRADRRHGLDRRTARGTGSSPTTAACSGSTHRSSGRWARWHLNSPIVGMAATPSGRGYWLFAGDGGVFTFGDAHFYGSTGALHLNSPIIEMIPGPDGKGYWLMATDGGVFTFGSARFHGSTGAKHLNAPIIGMAATPDGGGYLLVGSDGGVFTFGNAKFHGSTGNRHVTAPVVGMAGDSTGGGYWLATRDGSVYNFGDAKKQGGAKRTLGSAARSPRSRAVPGNGGYRLLALPAPIIVGPAARPGATGAAVVGIQERLLSLGYWLPGVSGVFDSVTQQAVWAFQKYENLPRTGVVDAATHNRMHSAVRPVPAVHERLRDRDRQDAPGADRRERRSRTVGVQRLQRVGPPVHARRRRLLRPHAGGHVQRDPGRRRVRQEPTRRALPAAVLHQHRRRGARLHRRAAVSRRPTGACGSRTRRSTSSGPTTSCRSAPRSGSTSEAPRRPASGAAPPGHQGI